MIDNRKYTEVLDSGLTLDHYFLLCYIKNNKPLIKHKRIKGFINLLNKKGYLQDEELTDKGLTLIQDCGFENVVLTQEDLAADADIDTFCSDLHKKCEDKLIQLVGKNQIRAKVDGKSYSFMPNLVDFTKTLHKVIKLYRITDLSKIEKTIISYISRCFYEGSWLPILQYYIFKNGTSQMYTEFDSEDEHQEPGTIQKFI